MSYMSDVCESLSRVLSRTATLQDHQVAGHAANIEFWAGEVVHALFLLDNYPVRFQIMREAQNAFASRLAARPVLDGCGEPIERGGPPVRRGIRTVELKRLRLDLCEAWRRCLSRMAQLKFIKTAEEQRLLELTKRGATL